MALQKDKQWKGYTANYWMITNHQYEKRSDSTVCQILCYKDKATRTLDINNSINEIGQGFNFKGDLGIAELYTKIKEPIMEQRISGYDEFTGQPVYEEVNVNFFTDAIDC